MGIPQPVKRYTPEEYYELERQAEFKSEYFDGEIFPVGEWQAMAGGSTRHSIISVNLIGELRHLLKGKPCAPYESNQRLRVKATGLCCYPDAAVYCGKLEYATDDTYKETAINPTVIFEVLSKSTESYDRGKKAEHYRQIDSLRAYVLISQDAPHIEVYERQGDGFWLLAEASGPDASIRLNPLEIDLKLAEIYDRVDFTAAEESAAAG